MNKKQISAMIEVFAEVEQMCEKPIFEVIEGDKHFKVWLNGRVEGFGDNAKVFNFYSVYLHHAILKLAHLIGGNNGGRNDSSPIKN